MSGQCGFSSDERIRRNFEYRNILKQGAFYRNGLFVLAISKSGTGRHRLGVTIGSSKLRLSSSRNRVKRLVREAFRLNKRNLKNGPYDIVVALAKTPAEKLNYSTVEKRLKSLLKKAKAL